MDKLLGIVCILESEWQYKIRNLSFSKVAMKNVNFIEYAHIFTCFSVWTLPIMPLNLIKNNNSIQSGSFSWNNFSVLAFYIVHNTTPGIHNHCINFPQFLQIAGHGRNKWSIEHSSSSSQKIHRPSQSSWRIPNFLSHSLVFTLPFHTNQTKDELSGELHYSKSNPIL